MEDATLIINGFGIGVLLVLAVSFIGWISTLVYRHMTSEKVLVNAIEKTIYNSVKVKINRNYEILEDLITSKTKNYVVTNDGIEFFLESTGMSYFLETGLENGYVPILSVVKK